MDFVKFKFYDQETKQSFTSYLNPTTVAFFHPIRDEVGKVVLQVMLKNGEVVFFDEEFEVFRAALIANDNNELGKTLYGTP
jgi:hypothetical protein